MSDLMPLTDEHFDVVICGGGLAGLTIARQLRRELPALRVAVIEPTTRPLPAGAHKVGESSVELGSMYLDSLGLRDYLTGQHILKLGLRFFPGDGHLPIEQRTEIGPPGDAYVTSYQMDRGKLESDLRGMIADDGAALFEGARVTAVELRPGDQPHTVRVERAEGEAATLTARWVVDATGRRALLRRGEDMGLPPTHVGNAGWFRISGRFDISAMGPADDPIWTGRPKASDRWRSTNHFMGDGYWVWVIPLTGGRTSIGIVVHASHHDFDRLRTLDRCMDFLDAFEPRLAEALKAHLDGEAVLDFRCLKHYSHDIERTLSPDRWAIVGEAGTFIDPLYSPGTDMIGLANSHAVELIRADVEGADLAPRAAELDEHFMAVVRWGFEIFARSAPVYGYAPAMAAKYYWDNFLYWSYHCEYFAQGIFRLSGEALAAFAPVRDGYRAVNLRMQAVLEQWALLADRGSEARFVTVPGVGSLSVESYISMLVEMAPEDTLEFMQLRLDQARQMLVEVVLRALAELGPERGAALVERTGLRDWKLPISDRRLEAATLEGKARRARLGKVGRDLEDHIHPLRPAPGAIEAMRLARAL